MSVLEQVRQLPEDERREVFEVLRNEFEEVPDWHVNVLEERKAKADRGEMVYSPHEDVFRRIRDEKASPSKS